MKISLLITASLLTLNLSGQKISEQLKKINSVEQAHTFIENYPKSEAQLFYIISDRDTSAITVPLFEKSPGFTFSIGDLRYKILVADSSSEFRASYIYMDGSQLTLNSIDSLREVILSKYKSGTSFIDLVREYTMDSNPTGDTGWFTENMMVKNLRRLYVDINSTRFSS